MTLHNYMQILQLIWTL